MSGSMSAYCRDSLHYENDADNIAYDIMGSLIQKVVSTFGSE